MKLLLKSTLLYLLMVSSCYAQDVRIPEYNHSGITTGDVLYWTGSAWDDVDIGTHAGTYIDLGDLANVSGTDSFSVGAGCTGGTWSPGSSQAKGVNIGGWCSYQIHWASSDNPSTNTYSLTATGLPWDNYNSAVNETCGSAYIYNTTDGVAESGKVFAADNTNFLYIDKDDYTQFLSTKNYYVRLHCTTRCDFP